jgi:Flp pilus assembly protein TadG
VTGSSQRGTVTLWLLGLTVALMTLAGLAVDLGRSFSTRRALASAADAAALAGAGAIDETVYRESGLVVLDPVEARRRAEASLAHQLDREALQSARVTADRTTVRVDVDGVVEPSLLRLLPLRDALTVHVGAIAHPNPSG